MRKGNQTLSVDQNNNKSLQNQKLNNDGIQKAHIDTIPNNNISSNQISDPSKETNSNLNIGNSRFSSVGIKQKPQDPKISLLTNNIKNGGETHSNS